MHRKRPLIALVALLFLSTTTLSCAPAPPCAAPHAPAPTTPAPTTTATAAPTTTAAEMARASSTLDRVHAAAAAANEDAYFALFAPGGVFLGTDAKERWTVPQFRAYAHPRFASGKAWSFRAARRDLQVRGDMAWFDEELDTPNLGPARGSGVLVRDAATGEWKVAQYNLSIPIPNERFAAVRKVIDDATPP